MLSSHVGISAMDTVTYHAIEPHSWDIVSMFKQATVFHIRNLVVNFFLFIKILIHGFEKYRFIAFYSKHFLQSNF